MPDKKAIRSVSIDKRELRALFAPDTFNAEKRTMDLVWTTGEKVLRYDWGQDTKYLEELVVTKDAVRMGRLNSGASLLDSHNSSQLASIIGVVERAWINDGEGRATVRFSERTPEIKAITDDIISGIIRNVSVGYRVHRMQKDEAGDQSIPVWRAIDWEPYEISMVPVGADAGAGTRIDTDQNPCELISAENVESNEGNAMPEPITTPSADVIATERQRAQEIKLACRAARMPQEFEDKHVAEGTPVDTVRKLVIEKIAAAPVVVQPTIVVGEEAAEAGFRGMEEALCLRVIPGTKQTAASADFSGMSLIELARKALELRGVRTAGMGRETIAKNALAMQKREGALMSAADFANILENVANKTLIKAYEDAPRTFVPFCSEAEATDFKPLSRVNMSGFPELLEVNENGEYTRGALTDSKESYSLTTFGRIIGLTRKAILNDDTRAFARLPAQAAAAGANVQSNVIYDLLAANAAMSDTIAFFHGSHGNLGTAGSPTVAKLTAGMLAMGIQTGPEGNFLNLTPKYIVAGKTYQAVIEQLVYGNFNPTASTSIVTQSMRSLIPIFDARITDNTWYLAADPAVIDGIEFAFLQGSKGITLETRNGFDVDGVEFKVKQDFGAGLVEYRGWYKFPNA